ncbi:MAG: hypothetical protein H8E89_11560 [Candidatus Nitrosopelagicus sp.]|nr:hypothetical protein [Candidatus Nitrosopelagicus sp.]
MRKLLLTLGVIFSILVTIPFVDAQLFEKATFQETATILYDQKFSNSVISSIGFETTNNEEIRFSNEVIQKIKDNEKIKAVIFTNAGECVIGVTTEEQCIMINFNYQQLKGDGGIRMVQDSAKEMGEKIINELNEALGMKGKFHSTFIHTVDDANILLETSGVVSGRGSVSATYVMPKQSTDFLFADLAGKLLPKEIREGGGFYKISKKMAKNDNSIISISIIRNENSNLFMFKVADETKNTSENISKINVLENLGVESISRSDIFDGRNVPLNSVIQLLIIPKEQSKIDAIATHAITDLTKLENISNKGWFFESPAGYKIDARFLFGQDKVIQHNELRMEIGPWNGESEVSFYSVENIENEGQGSMSDVMKENSEVEEQSQYIILGIIIAAGIGAAIFYLKGYKPKR